MSRGDNTRKTTEEASAQILRDFPEYDCSGVNYINAKTKITVACPVHGAFDRTLSYPHECPACSRAKRVLDRTGTTENFIERATKLHEGKYGYEAVQYLNARTKVSIFCKVHNSYFEQRPDTHLNRLAGCIKCRDDKLAADRSEDNEHFLDRSKKTHGDLFIYPELNYINAKTQVSAECRIHGKFLTYPDNHWSGAGCPSCITNGFNINKPSFFYILQSGNITKIGVTNNPPIKRVAQIIKDSGKPFVIVQTWHSILGAESLSSEKYFLNYLRGLYKSPIEKFDGYTECFFDVDLENLIELITHKLGDAECQIQ